MMTKSVDFESGIPYPCHTIDQRNDNSNRETHRTWESLQSSHSWDLKMYVFVYARVSMKIEVTVAHVTKGRRKYSRARYGSTKFGVTPGGCRNPPIGWIPSDWPSMNTAGKLDIVCIRVWKKLATPSFPISTWNSGIVSFEQLNQKFRSKS